MISSPSQTPKWMKNTDTDSDGRISYEEFKDSILENEKKNQAGDCGNAIGDMLAYKADMKAKSESPLVQAEANNKDAEKEDCAPTALDQTRRSSDLASILDKIFPKDMEDVGTEDHLADIENFALNEGILGE